MKNIFKTIVLLSLLTGAAAQASDDRLVLEGLQTVSEDVIQTVTYLNRQAFQAVIPEEMRQVLAEPKIEHEILDPLSLFAMTPHGLTKRYHFVQQGQYKLIDEKSFEITPFLGTSNLCNCVGVSIILPGKRAGLSHVSLDSYRMGSFAKLLTFFPEGVRGKCKVMLISTCWSSLFSDIRKDLTKGGFTSVSWDINPTYLDYETAPVKGKTHTIKYSSYEQDGMTAEDIQRFCAMKATSSPEAILSMISRFRIKATDPVEAPRGMLINVATGVSYQFYPKGHLSSNGFALERYNRIFEHFYGVISLLPLERQIPFIGEEITKQRNNQLKYLQNLREDEGDK